MFVIGSHFYFNSNFTQIIFYKLYDYYRWYYNRNHFAERCKKVKVYSQEVLDLNKTLLEVLL